MGSVVKRVTRPIRKIAKKIIPKEIKPFLPYIAAFYGGPAMAGSNFMKSGIGNQFLRNAVSKGLIAGATAGATDEDANILRTAALAGAPDLISGGLGKLAGPTGPDTKGLMGALRGGARTIADSKYLNAEGVKGLGNNLKMIGVQGSVDAAAQLAELNQEEIDKYNASLGGNLDRGERRAQLTAIFSRAGYEPEYIDTMLTTYGYAQGGIASLRSGYEEGGTVTISKKEYERLKGDKEIAQGIDFASTGLGMLGKSGHSMEPVGMLKFARGGEVMDVDAQFDALYKDTVGKKYPEQSMDPEIARRARKYMQMGGIESAEAAYALAEQEYMDEIMSKYPNLSSSMGMARGGEVIEESETLMAGGPYGSGRDTQDAMNVWQGMGIEDKSLFEGFIDFYKNGSWRDQIMGQADIEENTMMASAPSLEDSLNEKSLMMFRKPYYELTEEEVELLNEMATGGRVGYAGGGTMNRNLLNTGVDKDMRTGGFIPEGTREKADDVPARLSKNEFVMTADAVKAAGGGSVNRGAQRMYNLMNNLEAKV